MPAHILFIYSLVVAIFLTVSGALSAKTTQQYLFQILFLPITLYLVAIALATLRRTERRTRKSRLVIVGICAVFFVLLIASVLNVIVKSQSSP